MGTVRWTQGARDDLRGIHHFVLRDSPGAADALLNRVVTAAERLMLFPRSGRIVPELAGLGYREIIVGSYRLVYAHEDDTVWIVAVTHGRRPLDGSRFA